MTPEELRQKVEDAIERGKQFLEEIEEAQTNSEEIQRKEAETKAANILAQFPTSAGKAVRMGQGYALVMYLEDRDFKQEAFDLPLLRVPENLTGAAQIVFDTCRKAGFELYIYTEHSGQTWHRWGLYLRLGASQS